MPQFLTLILALAEKIWLAYLASRAAHAAQLETENAATKVLLTTTQKVDDEISKLSDADVVARLRRDWQRRE